MQANRLLLAASDREWLDRATELTINALRQGLEESGRARWVLAGGGTPLPLYRELAAQHRETLDWSKVDFFWGDERSVPPDDTASNFGSAASTLLAPLSIEAAQIHRIEGEVAPEVAAARYGRVVARALSAGDWDLVLLGIGADGHTASLFPPIPSDGRSPLVAATEAPTPPHERVSLTPRALNRAHEVVFLAAGAGKAAAVRRAREGDPTLPAAQIRPRGRLAWCLAPDLAAELAGSHRRVESKAPHQEG